MCEDNVDRRLNALLSEFERVQGKAAATDGAFMTYLSVGVTPFLIFTAYAAVERQFQIFLAALPILTVLGFSVVVVVSMHYKYASAYLIYLEERINEILGRREIRDSDFSHRAYSRPSSPVIASYIIALISLVALNIIAIPAINVFLCRFRQRSGVPDGLKYVADLYWYAVVPFVAASISWLVIASQRAWANLRLTSFVAIASMRKP